MFKKLKAKIKELEERIERLEQIIRDQQTKEEKPNYFGGGQ